MTLGDFIRQEAGKPFLWGETDCASRVDRWVYAQTLISPKQECGLRYSEIEPGFGILRAMRSGMRQFPKTKSVKAGDVGIVAMHGVAIAAIYSGSAWIAWGEDGMMMHKSPRVLMAWAI